MTSVEKLIVKLNTDLGFTGLSPESFKRHYPGKWQRSGGAWTWSIDCGYKSIGSCWPVKDLIKRNVKIVAVPDYRWTALIEVCPEEID